MSWTDVFPILTDEMVEEYVQAVGPDEDGLLNEWFDVAEVHNEQPSRHVVSTSLFWKHPHSNQGELPPLTLDLVKNALKLGIVERFSPWEHYIVPTLVGAAKLKTLRPDVTFRVYLAADMEFLIQDLVEAGCEVCLMKSSSIRHNPGAMWRFLALAEQDRLVTITDSDRAIEVITDMDRTELIAEQGFARWRMAYTFGDDKHCPAHYRPVLACQFGSAKALDVERLMKAMRWHEMRGSLKGVCRIADKEIPLLGAKWPDYCYDEWFIQAALYPRLAQDGVVTLVAWDDVHLSQWFALDIEYVTWANPMSEIVHFSREKPMEEGEEDAEDIEEGVLAHAPDPPVV